MGFPWKKLANVGLGVASMFVPGLVGAIQVVEDNMGGLKGPQKKEAAISIAKSVVMAIESGTDKDIINDEKVVAATGHFVDAFVMAENAKAELIQAIQDAKKAKT